MIKLIADLPRHVVGISVKGRVTKEECRTVLAPAIARALRWRDKIRLYYELGSRFPGSGWDDLDLGFEHAARCERVAIVTDIAWVRLTVKTIRFLIPGDIRVFSTIEAEDARAWIMARLSSHPDAENTAAMAAGARRPRQGKPSRPHVPVPLPARPAPSEQRDRGYGC